MKNAEAESAFKIWEKMAELKDMMWKHYYNEFLELCMELEQPDQNSLDYTQNDENPF